MKNIKNGKQMASEDAKVWSKADVRYWRKKVFQPVSGSGGQVPDYSARISHQLKRHIFALRTPNRDSAAERARDIYVHLLANGWESTLQKYKPEIHKPTTTAKVGELITAACSVSSARRFTLDAYTKAFRRIVSEVMEIQSGRKFDAIKGGTKAWREAVDAVDLGELTPADIQAWKNRRLRAAESNPEERKSAIVTVNSLIRNAKALFGKKVLPFIQQKVQLPKPLPFDGVQLEKSPSLRYRSKVDAFAILARAKEELAEADPEAFKVLVLALVFGLRRSEIDNLLWKAFDFAKAVLRVESTEYHELKSEDSAGEIDMDDDMVRMFRQFRTAAPKDLFVIVSPNPPRREMKSRCYRCNDVFERVNTWLRRQGVDSVKPLHTMRKEIGSIIASEHGIFEASRYLRHSDIRITSAIYADKKKTVTPTMFNGILAATGKGLEGTVRQGV